MWAYSHAINHPTIVRRLSMLIDSKRICKAEGCRNVGEWDSIFKGKVRRRSLCSKHRKKRPHIDKSRPNSINVCEYCGWNGPCDIHRPVTGATGGQYEKGNMRNTCPNCHRLISMGLLKDKFLKDFNSIEFKYNTYKWKAVYSSIL